MSEPSDSAFQICITPGCRATFSVDEVHVACPKCGNLLDIDYDWNRIPVPSSLREFEARWSTRNNPLDFSGVWRFRELLKFAPDASVVTIKAATPRPENTMLTTLAGWSLGVVQQ